MKKIIPLMFLFCGCNLTELTIVTNNIEEVAEGAEAPENYPPENPRGLNGSMQR